MEREKRKNRILKRILLVLITILCVIFIIGVGNDIRLNIIGWWTYNKEEFILFTVLRKTWICIEIAFQIALEIVFLLLPFCLPWENIKKRRDKDGKH